MNITTGSRANIAGGRRKLHTSSVSKRAASSRNSKAHATGECANTSGEVEVEAEAEGAEGESASRNTRNLKPNFFFAIRVKDAQVRALCDYRIDVRCNSHCSHVLSTLRVDR